MNHRTRKSGFTLIEILIVTVIIGILATLGLIAYSSALKNGRNARRISDLNAIQAAFEQHFTGNSAYVAGCGGVMDDSLQGGIPTDPNGGSYTGAGGCTTTSYCVCAALEPAGSGAAGSSPVRGGNSGNATCTSYTTNGSGAYYCVQNRQ